MDNKDILNEKELWYITMCVAYADVIMRQFAVPDLMFEGGHVKPFNVNLTAAELIKHKERIKTVIEGELIKADGHEATLLEIAVVLAGAKLNGMWSLPMTGDNDDRPSKNYSH